MVAGRSLPTMAATASNPKNRRRNIVLVVADDFGIDASGLYRLPGGEAALKPNMPTISGLAAAGVVFDNCWVNPVCTPTRSTIFTGRYGFRTGVLAVDDLLDPNQGTIFQRLKQGGYSTAVFGKWHVGGNPAPLDHPGRCGVDTFGGFMQGGVEDYFSWAGVEGQGTALKPFTSTTYTTTWFTDRAIAWAKQRAKQPTKPWMLALTFNAPHLPLHAPPAALHSRGALSGLRPDIRDRPIEYYLAAAEALDAEFGRFWKSLSASVRSNTTVIFLGDNGTARRVIQAPYAMADGKGTVKTGGVHVPLVVSGAGVTRRGIREPALVNGVDLYATIADIARLPSPSTGSTVTDSVSFAPSLTGSFSGRTWIYSEIVRQAAATDTDSDTAEPVNAWAIRNDRVALVRNELTGTEQLYDVKADPAQLTDLATDPARAADLQALRDVKASVLR
jgi:arylsulfatase A-like enzyme